MQTIQYDYIIAGAGCAGLSLLYKILQSPTLATKKILLIDQHPKNTNDRTWCFWENKPSEFEHLTLHTYQQIYFASQLYSAEISLENYQYKMIRGIDFYLAVMQRAKAFSNVTFVNETIINLSSNNNIATATTTTHTYTAHFIFNSIIWKNIEQISSSKGNYFLLQHFKGWMIETPDNIFNPSVATLMDFTISQQYGTAFMYVLPTSANTAMIEYTLFTKKLLAPKQYEIELKKYIQDKLRITHFNITHEEYGIIPMTNHQFKLQEGNIIHIGIAGGQAKGSSGYAFQFIQKRTSKIVSQLIANNQPFCKETFNDKKFRFYDSVLLQVLEQNKMNGDTIFANIFKKNSIKNILQFLDNESNFLTDLKIMSSVPLKIFLPAALKQFFK